MDCPVCKEPMIVLELKEIEIDYCSSCGGIWLDAGELALLLEDTEKKDRLLSSFTVDDRSKEKGRKCPICSKRMEKVLSGIDKKVRIDRCRKKDGLWFDRGELEEVLKMGSFDEDNRVLEHLKDLFSE